MLLLSGITIYIVARYKLPRKSAQNILEYLAVGSYQPLQGWSSMLLERTYHSELGRIVGLELVAHDCCLTSVMLRQESCMRSAWAV